MNPTTEQVADWLNDFARGNAWSKVRYVVRHPLLAVRFSRAFNKAFPR